MSSYNKKPQRITLPRKPKYITISADCDFFALFKTVEKHFDNCFMLESLGEESFISRHSIIGFDPEKLIWAEGKQLFIQERDGSTESYESENPYYLLRDIVPQNILSRGFAGGLTGYLGYDSMNYFEPTFGFAIERDVSTRFVLACTKMA